MIADDAVLDGAAWHGAFEHVAGFLEHSDGTVIVGKWQREDPCEVEVPKRCIRDGADGLGPDASSPEGLSQPVADFGRDPFDVALEHESDAAHRVPTDVDRPVRGGSRRGHMFQKFAAVLFAVRIRKAIAKVDRDAAIVGVMDKRVEVSERPVADERAGQFDAHL